LVMATNIDGALTFLFESDKEVTNSGWKAIVNSVKSTNSPVIFDKKINVFPNPVSDIINIDSDNPIIRITLINSTGTIIANKEVDHSMHEVYSLAGRTPGVYILIIYTEKSIPEKALIIKK